MEYRLACIQRIQAEVSSSGHKKFHISRTCRQFSYPRFYVSLMPIWIQMCSLSMQVRVSKDYFPGNDQWKIGVTSIFAYAMGIAPFKDNFWSTTNQPFSPYSQCIPNRFVLFLSFCFTVSHCPTSSSSCCCWWWWWRISRPSHAISITNRTVIYFSFPSSSSCCCRLWWWWRWW